MKTIFLATMLAMLGVACGAPADPPSEPGPTTTESKAPPAVQDPGAKTESCINSVCNNYCRSCGAHGGSCEGQNCVCVGECQ